MLENLARSCYRRRRTVVASWIVAVIGFTVLSNAAGGEFGGNFELPGFESQAAFDLLDEKFPEQDDGGAQLAIRAEAGFDAPEVRAALEQAFADLAALDPVILEVQSPYDNPFQFSPLEPIAFAPVLFEAAGPDVEPEVGKAIIDFVEERSTEEIQIEAGGPIIRFSGEQGPGEREIVGIIAAVFILLFTFGTVVAMGLPIMVAIFALGIGLALVSLGANVVDVPEFTPTLASMIGLGVGIDYALFIITRYRASLHAGATPEDAVVVAISTAGRAVIFAGATVVISFLGLLLIGLKFMQGVALGGAATVALTVLASITLLPAVLGFAGHKIDSLKVPGRHLERSHRDSWWFSWSRTIQKRPVVPALLAFVLLALLTVPLFSLRLGSSDAGNDSPDVTSRRAYDLLAEGFGPGFNGPLLFVTEIPTEGGLEAVGALTAAIQKTNGVVFVAPPRVNEAGDTVAVFAFPSTSPQSQETEDLIAELREVVPAATESLGLDVKLGGPTAIFVDMSAFLGDRLPIFIGAVLVLSFLLLMVVFRSLLVPLKAAFMNLLGIGAAYGIIVAIFQWGWGAGLIGVDQTGPIENFVPMMMFAIVFGLSMDYEVFLISRMHEEWIRTGDNATSVADGLAATARVITAAAAIMVTLFLSFVLGDDRIIKMFGLGLALAVFLDATIVRMVLVPSTMEMLGDANWWLPKWLDRILPRIQVDSTNELAAKMLDDELHDLLDEDEREPETTGAD